jgi:hypothetical protein
VEREELTGPFRFENEEEAMIYFGFTTSTKVLASISYHHS